MKIGEIEHNQPHLYLDIDGVQADFFTAWARWHANRFDTNRAERYKDVDDTKPEQLKFFVTNFVTNVVSNKKEREQSVAELNKEGPEFVEKFFATLPVLPGFPKLLEFLNYNQIKFTVLSAPLRNNHEASIAGKKSWLDRYNPGSSDTAIFTSNKEKYAVTKGRPNVLVDDYEKFIKSWTGRGGIGVLHRDNNVPATISQLKEIYNIQLPIESWAGNR